MEWIAKYHILLHRFSIMKQNNQRKILNQILVYFNIFVDKDYPDFVKANVIALNLSSKISENV